MNNLRNITISIILVIICVLLSSCNDKQTIIISTQMKTDTPTQSQTKAVTPTTTNTTLNNITYSQQIFITDRDINQRLVHRFILFSLNKNTVVENSVDLSKFGWDTWFPNSRFDLANASEFIHFNPITKNVIFFLYPHPGGEADWKPEDVLPDPPFNFAIYQTDITFTAPRQIYVSNGFDIDHTILNPTNNTLLLDVHTFYPGNKQEILKFDIASGKIEVINQTNPFITESGELIESSDLQISSDGKQLYQLLLYGKERYWTNQTLYLSTIELENSKSVIEKIDSGDDVHFDISGISVESRKVSFITRVDGEYILWVKDLLKGKLIEIATTKINNYQVFNSPDGTKILICLESGWKYYDLSTKTYHSTFIKRPYLWDPSGRYIVGLKNNKYVIFDIQTEKDIEIPINADPNNYEVESAQWR